MRLRPRSIRGRDTLIAAVIALLVLGAVAAGLDLLLRGAVKGQVLAETQVAARRVSAAVRDGTLTSPIPADPNRVELLQVVGPDRRVRVTSAAAAGLPPLSTRHPPPDDRVQDLTECPGPTGDCLLVEAIRVTTAPDSVVVYAAHPIPAVLTSGLLETLLAMSVLALSALVAWITWRVVGRTLRPVAAIQAKLAEISGSDLSRRVPEPAGQDEIAELARTANATLDRLQRAVDRQRQFASDASHELRTPITALRANLEDAAMHPGDTDLTAVIEAALRDTDRLESIVTDLLLLARIGTGGVVAQEPIDLSALLAGELARRNGKVRVRPGLTPGLRVRGVRMQLVRLLDNLLDNAERYADTLIEVVAVRDAGDALVTITDDGPGIPRADRERVFERFTRLDSARSRGAGGTGLGLAIARDITAAHGGSLRAVDSPRGARFALRLPLVDGEHD